MPGFAGTYDPSLNTITVGGVTIPGPFGENDIVKVSRNEDAFTLQIGAGGGGVRTRNANKSGRVEITVNQGSKANKILSAFASLDEATGEGVGPFLMKDNSDLGTIAEAENVWVTKQADIARGKTAGENTWILETDLLKLKHDNLPLAT